jgi:hypothetical protein
MARWRIAAPLLLVLIASLRIVSTYKVFNFVIDAPAHIACAAEWLEAGVYRYGVLHPPLARAVLLKQWLLLLNKAPRRSC